MLNKIFQEIINWLKEKNYYHTTTLFSFMNTYRKNIHYQLWINFKSWKKKKIFFSQDKALWNLFRFRNLSCFRRIWFIGFALLMTIKFFIGIFRRHEGKLQFWISSRKKKASKLLIQFKYLNCLVHSFFSPGLTRINY